MRPLRLFLLIKDDCLNFTYYSRLIFKLYRAMRYTLYTKFGIIYNGLKNPIKYLCSSKDGRKKKRFTLIKNHISAFNKAAIKG